MNQMNLMGAVCWDVALALISAHLALPRSNGVAQIQWERMQRSGQSQKLDSLFGRSLVAVLHATTRTGSAGGHRGRIKEIQYIFSELRERGRLVQPTGRKQAGVVDHEPLDRIVAWARHLTGGYAR